MENSNFNQPLGEKDNTVVEQQSLIDRLKLRFNEFFSEASETTEVDEPEIIAQLKSRFKIFEKEIADNVEQSVPASFPATSSRSITMTINIDGSDNATLTSVEHCNNTLIVKLQI